MKDSKKIDGWRDLEEYGFIGLTGESCGIGIRYLVDLTPEGLDNLNTFLSCQIAPGNNWNTSDGQIASVMIPWGWWRELAIFLLIAEGNERVIDVKFHDRDIGIHADYVCAMPAEQWEEDRESFDRIYQGHYRVWYASGDRKGGTRNLHHWTGRVE